MTLSWARIDSFAGNHSSPALASDRECPVCGSTRSRPVLEIEDFQFYTDSAERPKRLDVRQVQCCRCFALYMNPCYTPYGFETLFAEAGQSYGSSRASEQIDWLSTRNLISPGARLLDVGCYDGRFLAVVPPHVSRTGVDVDAPAIERARRMFGGDGIDFVCGAFESFEFDGPADTITMFHVLEHLPTPVPALARLRSIAHPGTRLVVEVPILERGATNDINGFLTVQHLTHFGRRSLRNCLRQCGWEPLEWHEPEDYNGCRVLAGLAESRWPIEINPGEIPLLHEYLAGWYAALANASKKIALLADHERRVLWGAGTHTELVYKLTPCFADSRPVDYLIVDSDPLKQAKTWRGIRISPPSLLTEVDWSRAVLLLSSYGSQDMLHDAALELGVPEQRIVRLYDEVRAY